MPLLLFDNTNDTLSSVRALFISVDKKRGRDRLPVVFPFVIDCG